MHSRTKTRDISNKLKNLLIIIKLVNYIIMNVYKITYSIARKYYIVTSVNV